MPSPIPSTRLLLTELFPSVSLGACSSPLTQQSQGSSLQVPVLRLRPCPSSVIQWDQLRSVEPVGSGGFGSVYRAEYQGRSVALKKVKKFSKNRLASWQSFWAELNAAHLSHPNIVRVLMASTGGPGSSGGLGCGVPESSIGTILMEFVGSKNLQQVINGAGGPLGPQRWLRYATHITRGLDFLHAHRVVHLDIKPANVLLSPQDVCKIADFGCSLKLDQGHEETVLGPHLSHVCGTYTHRAPELLRGRAVSFKADIFSLGITLWQLRTGEPPYTGDRHHILYAVVAHHLRPPLHHHPAFQSQQGLLCVALLSRCWSGEARDRPSARELLLELELLRSEAGATAELPLH